MLSKVISHPISRCWSLYLNLTHNAVRQNARRFNIWCSINLVILWCSVLSRIFVKSSEIANFYFYERYPSLHFCCKIVLFWYWKCALLLNATICGTECTFLLRWIRGVFPYISHCPSKIEPSSATSGKGEKGEWEGVSELVIVIVCYNLMKYP